MQNRNLVKVAAIAAVGALILTGCSNSKKKSGGLNNSSASGTSAAAAATTYAIGTEFALSGDNKALGQNPENAVELAVAQANATGNLGFTLTVVKSDDGGVNAQAPAAAAALIGNASVVGVVGPGFSGPTTATGKKYAAAHMALISPSATNATLTTSGFTTFHRIVPTDGVEGKATADYLAKKFKSVFVLDDTSVYGKGVGDVVRAELKAKGVTVKSASSAVGTTPGNSDFGSVAQSIVASKAQAMYYGGYDAAAALLAKALKGQNYKGFRISGNGPKSVVFSTNAAAAGNGYYFACGCLDATSAPAAKDFTAAYKAKFHSAPSTYAPEGYDAANAMITAIKAAKAAGPVTRASVEDQVNKLDYKGITTTVKFTPSGEVAQATINLYEDKNGTIELLGDLKTQK